jgi:regulator of sirC expression with transglutaminase-like and TPR domain
MSEDKIRALIDLIDKEPRFKAELAEQLAKIIKTQPQQFKEVIVKDYGGAVPCCVADIINAVHRENLKQPFKWYFARRSPDLRQGANLIARFINPGMKEAPLNAPFEMLKSAIAAEINEAVDIRQKADLLGCLLFGQFNFRLEPLSNDALLLCLPDIIKRRRASPFSMAVLYLLLSRNFDIIADITDVEGKPIVRLRDGITREPVYVDICSKGRFVGDEDCHLYAAGRGFEWNSGVMRPMDNKAVARRLIANLIYVYSKEGSSSSALELLREFLNLYK